MYAFKADGFHLFEGYPFCIDGLAGYVVGGDNYDLSLQNIMNTCGVGAGLMSEESLPLVKEAFQEGEKSVFREQVDLLRPGYIIAMYKDTFSGLTEDEELGILSHELGHIKLGHLEDLSLPRNEHGLIESVQAELEADAYAAKRVGKDVMKNAIQKVFRNTFRLQKNLMDARINVDEEFEYIMNREDMRLRMAALS